MEIKDFNCITSTCLQCLIVSVIVQVFLYFRGTLLFFGENDRCDMIWAAAFLRVRREWLAEHSVQQSTLIEILIKIDKY